MFGHRTFLLLGGNAGDILSLIKGGYEVSRFSFPIEQGIDHKGKATTRVYAGALSITLSQLPPTSIIEWALHSRKYSEGTIVMLDANNLPIEKILFKNAACIGMDLDYTQKGQSYASTKLTVLAEQLVVGSGISFNNEWITD